MKTLNKTEAGIIAHVHAKASIKNDPTVYGLAFIPPPRKKSPLGAPGTPKNFNTKLDAIGQLTLTWQCKHPRGAEGTQYHMFRSIGVNGVMERIGSSGTKRFVDTTIPAGATRLTYEIYAQRSNQRSETANFNVSFGTNQPAERIIRKPNHQIRRAA